MEVFNLIHFNEHSQRSLQTKYSAILYMLLSCLFYVFMYGAVKYLTNKSVTPMVLVFYRNLFAAIIILPFILKNYNIKKIYSQFTRVNFLRGFMSFISTILAFAAITKIDLNKSAAISFTLPLFTSALAIIFLKESLTINKFFALVLGFIGCNIILGTSFSEIDKYELLALASCFTWAISNIFVKQLSEIQDATLIGFYSFCTVSLLSLPWIIYDCYLPSLYDSMVLIMVGITSIFAQIFLIKSFKYGELTLVTPFLFSKLVFSSILSYILFSVIITENIIYGSILIISGNILLLKATKS